MVLAVAVVGAVLVLAAFQAAGNLKARGIASGFGYLHRAAGFEISPGPLAYSSRDTYVRALEVGLVNTVRVALLGILVAILRHSEWLRAWWATPARVVEPLHIASSSSLAPTATTACDPQASPSRRLR